MPNGRLRSSMRRLPLQLWLLILLSAVLQTLPFPLAGPVPLWRTAFCWIALVPLLAAVLRTDRLHEPLTLRQAACLGYLCGILWYLGNCYWIYQTMYLYGGLPKPIALAILFLFSLYLGLYHALFASLIAAFRRSALGIHGALLLAPFAWVAVELARARITGFPWDLLGLTQVDNPLLMRLPPTTGAYGVSFVIAAVNALWLLRIRVRERRYTRQILTLGGIAILGLYLALLRSSQSPNHLATTQTATLVQSNLGVGTEASANDESTSELISSLSHLSLKPPADRCLGIPELPSTKCLHFIPEQDTAPTATKQTNLIAWPESPAGFLTTDSFFRERMTNLAHTARSPLIIGSLGYEVDTAGLTRKFDSAALVRPDGTSAGRYDKIHLVPWGEYIPYKDLFFFARKLTAGVGDMDRGTDRTIFRTEGHAIGVFICYESIFGDEVRQFVKNGAEVLVNISDDGWYGDTSAAWQHLNMVRMRAIENHRWVLRSTNTGVTAAIDPFGHVTAAAPRHQRTALYTGFNYEHPVTSYTVHGDLFAYACAAVTILALLAARLPRQTRS